MDYSTETRVVTFQNQGILDIRAITTFGVNVKESDSAIGYFGTGLKYAIAVLLREGQTIRIVAGEEEYEFYTQREEIRGKDFEMVYMNERPLGFTLELGKNWKLWQAFREIYCNMKDEGGDAHEGMAQHSEGMTSIYIFGDEFYETYQNKHKYFLESEPIHRLWTVNIHPERPSGAIFYRGIKVYESELPLKHTYNIHNGVTLTEDRTISTVYSAAREIAQSIAMCNDPQLIESMIINQGSGSFEDRLDYDYPFFTPTKTFLDVVEGNKLTIGINQSAVKLLYKHRKPKEIQATTLNDLQAKQLKKATDFCKAIGYNVTKYPITVSEELSKGLMGMAHCSSKQIYLSPDNFTMGTKYLAATLIEEFLHIETGFSDCTRELQNRLFQDIVTLGEHITGEPI